MTLLLDYLPIVAFFIAYKMSDFFVATKVLMVAMPLVLALQYLLTRKLNRIYAASTVLVLVAGAATLYFRSSAFLYWKPTVLNWAFAAVFLASQWIGDRPMVSRMLGEAIELTGGQWRRLNTIWAVYFFVLGAVNLYVAFNFSEQIWVDFKLFGMLGLTVVFIIIQAVWLSTMMNRNDAAASDSKD